MFEQRDWGVPGSPIPGSRLYRGYCDQCGEPIRVISDSGYGICRDCREGFHPGANTLHGTDEWDVEYIEDELVSWCETLLLLPEFQAAVSDVEDCLGFREKPRQRKSRSPDHEKLG